MPIHVEPRWLRIARASTEGKGGPGAAQRRGRFCHTGSNAGSNTSRPETCNGDKEALSSKAKHRPTPQLHALARRPQRCSAPWPRRVTKVLPYAGCRPPSPNPKAATGGPAAAGIHNLFLGVTLRVAFSKTLERPYERRRSSWSRGSSRFTSSSIFLHKKPLV